ncbi:hypothetical protein QEZ54_01760 [Catellatospora sp. KI3]|uniref:hypothetical protein n=1 Tax=Catellatospora sp. KI3 TaxID=3041620 RepID=UPI002482E3EB|nr:hypothetical protein [Catellatospora sp. KI3]MDI1459684.1 hypothetical protein [Catellatospora sp. KI3]
MAFGTAGMGVDPRVVAGGLVDPRTAWWRTQSPNVILAALVVACQVFGQATWSGEPVSMLLVPTAVGAAVALAVVNVVVTRFGMGPSVAAGVALLATVVVTVLPCLAVPALAIDGTLFHWMRGDPQRMPVVTTGAVVWLGLAAAVLLGARLLPADVSGLRWIARGESGRD